MIVSSWAIALLSHEMGWETPVEHPPGQAAHCPFGSGHGQPRVLILALPSSKQLPLLSVKCWRGFDSEGMESRLFLAIFAPVVLPCA